MMSQKRGSHCINKFCEISKENALKMINVENKKMLPLTVKDQNNIKIKKHVTCVMTNLIIEIMKN